MGRDRCRSIFIEKNMKKIKLLGFGVITLSLVFIVSACSLIPSSDITVEYLEDNLAFNDGSTFISDNIADQGKVRKFRNAQEFNEFLEANAISYSSNRMFFESIDVGMDSAMSVSQSLSKESTESVTGRGGSSSDFSETNVQVAGVDEADIIKTDGKYIYAVVEQELFIIDAFPAEGAKIVSKIRFKSRPKDIYINGDSLIVFGYDNRMYQDGAFRQFVRRNSYTFFKVFDVTDRSNPEQVRDLKFEGNYSNSRMIGDYVYLITNLYTTYMEGEIPLPRLIENGNLVASECIGSLKCFTPDVYYFNIPYQNFNLANISAINIKDNDKDVTGESYLLSGGQNLYVSQDNIYITYTKNINVYDLEMDAAREIVYPLLSTENKDKISKIESVDNFILNKNEKRNKITEIVQGYAIGLNQAEQESLNEKIDKKFKAMYEEIKEELQKTVIHKINIKGDKLEYDTFGEVSGRVLNQFSMDEKDGYFRIATTRDRDWFSSFNGESRNTESYNNLYILDSDLKVVGSVEKLAEGERIYSVRFMQDRAYMVTFKQVDPLFVIDLSDVRNPKVLGSLKIPGFSNYLHPYDENTLIGFGKDTEENESGRVITKGLKLSLFEVSDPSNPKELDTYVMGDSGSNSEALNDHRAFLFSKEKNLLSIPVMIRERTSSGWGDITFNGANVFSIEDGKFVLRGKVNHSQGSKSWNESYDTNVKRSLYIDDKLYTLSNRFLKINDLDDLEEVNSIKLKTDVEIIRDIDIFREIEKTDGDFEVFSEETEEMNLDIFGEL